MPKPPPLDEWIFGEGPPRSGQDRRQYVFHAAFPRFIAELIDEDEDDDPRGPIEMVLSSGELACRFLWFDRPDDPGDIDFLNDLRRRMDDALEISDADYTEE